MSSLIVPNSDNCESSYIAFVDDDRQFIEALRARIHHKPIDWDIHFFCSAREAIEQIKVKSTAVIISDRHMPDIDGIEFCEKIRGLQSKDDGPSFYFIMLSEMSETEHLIEGLDHGADDYLSKPFDPQELLARIRVGLRLTQIEHNLKQSCRQYQKLATLDSLTGLLNRRGGLDRALPELARVRRGYQGISISLIDVDHFKQINDTYGHAVGDKVLVELSRELLQCVREYDILARWGGEEFLLILPDTSERASLAITERIRSRINQIKLSEIDLDSVNISVSIGVTYVPPSCNEEFDTILQVVDSALYRAKESGRNCLIVGQIELNESVSQLV